MHPVLRGIHSEPGTLIRNTGMKRDELLMLNTQVIIYLKGLSASPLWLFIASSSRPGSECVPFPSVLPGAVGQRGTDLFSQGSELAMPTDPEELTKQKSSNQNKQSRLVRLWPPHAEAELTTERLAPQRAAPFALVFDCSLRRPIRQRSRCHVSCSLLIYNIPGASFNEITS